MTVILGEYLNRTHPWLGLAADLGVPIFGHAHGYDVSQLLREEQWRRKYLDYNESAGIITMSALTRDRLVRLGLRPDKVHVVPYGVDVPDSPPARAAGDRVQCLVVGRLVAKKGVVFSIDAFRRAAEVDSRLHLHLVGGGVALPTVRQLLRVFEIEDRVTLHGPLPNDKVRELMRDADIFLQHSVVDPDTGDEEGLPVVILEAMAHGLPVVATRHAGIPEAVRDGETGFLVDEGDSREMGRRILDLAREPDLRQTLGVGGWKRAAAHYRWERERADLLRILGL